MITGLAVAAVVGQLVTIQADMKEGTRESSLKTSLAFEAGKPKVVGTIGNGEMRITLVSRTAEVLRFLVEYVNNFKVVPLGDVTTAPGEPVGISSIGPTTEISVLLSTPKAGG